MASVVINETKKISQLPQKSSLSAEDKFIVTSGRKSYHTTYEDLYSAVVGKEIDPKLNDMQKQIARCGVSSENALSTANSVSADLRRHMISADNMATVSTFGKIKLIANPSGMGADQYPLKLDGDGRAYVEVTGGGGGEAPADLREDINKLCSQYCLPHERCLFAANDKDALLNTDWNPKKQPVKLSSTQTELLRGISERGLLNLSSLQHEAGIEFLSGQVSTVSAEQVEAVKAQSDINSNYDSRIAYLENSHFAQQIACEKYTPIYICDGISSLSDALFESQIYEVSSYSMYRIELSSFLDSQDYPRLVENRVYEIEGVSVEAGTKVLALDSCPYQDATISGCWVFNQYDVRVGGLTLSADDAARKIQELQKAAVGGVVYKGHTQFVIPLETKSYDLSTIIAYFYNTHGETSNTILRYDEGTSEYQLLKSLPLKNGWMFLADVDNPTGKTVTRDGVAVSHNDFIIVHNHAGDAEVQLSDITRESIDIVQTEDSDYVKFQDLSDVSAEVIASCRVSVEYAYQKAADRIDEQASILRAEALSVRAELDELVFRSHIEYGPLKKTVYVGDYVGSGLDGDYLVNMTFRNYSAGAASPKVRLGTAGSGDYPYGVNFAGTPWRSDVSSEGDAFANWYSVLSSGSAEIDLDRDGVTNVMSIHRVRNGIIYSRMLPATAYGEGGLSAPAMFACISGYNSFSSVPDFADSGKVAGDIKFYDVKSVHFMKYGFARCVRLNSVWFDGTESAGNNAFEMAFSGCVELTRVSFPDLIRIGEDAFLNAYASCGNAIYVALPKLVSEGVPYDTWSLPVGSEIAFQDKTVYITE